MNRVLMCLVALLSVGVFSAPTRYWTARRCIETARQCRSAGTDGPPCWIARWYQFFKAEVRCLTLKRRHVGGGLNGPSPGLLVV